MIAFGRCKINVGLEVTGVLPDGYHTLVTAMYPVWWGDVLEIVPAQGEETVLRVSGLGVDCAPERNLVMRAYRAFAAAVPGTPAYDMYLLKVVPSGAGLGGGSADAALALQMLNELGGEPLTRAQLHALAAGLGADCPYFLYEGPMLARGTGTELEPLALSLQGYDIAVVKPPVFVSTAEAYRGVGVVAEGALEGALQLGVEQWPGLVKNAFEGHVLAGHPQIAAVKGGLVEAGAVYASMSGSGSAVYGLFRHGEMTEGRLRELFPEAEAWHVSPARY